MKTKVKASFANLSARIAACALVLSLFLPTLNAAPRPATDRGGLIEITTPDENFSVFAKNKTAGAVILKNAAANAEAIRAEVEKWLGHRFTPLKTIIVCAPDPPEPRLGFVTSLRDVKLRVFIPEDCPPHELGRLIARGYLACVPQETGQAERNAIARTLPDWLAHAAMYKSLYDIFGNAAQTGGKLVFDGFAFFRAFLLANNLTEANSRRAYFVSRSLFRTDSEEGADLEEFLLRLAQGRTTEQAITALIADMNAFFAVYKNDCMQASVLHPTPSRPTMDRIKSMHEIYSILRFSLRDENGRRLTENSSGGYYYFIGDLPLRRCCRTAVGRRRLAQMYTSLMALKLRSTAEVRELADLYIAAMLTPKDRRFRRSLKRAEKRMRAFCTLAPDEAAALSGDGI